MILNKRLAGVLLHPTSLPGPHGIGDLGPSAVRFLDWLQQAGFGIWQVLPLGPTGYGDSPYQCFSAFAGNQYLISPELLVQEGLLTKSEIKAPRYPAGRIDYGPVIERKMALLGKAFARFRAGEFAELNARLAAFRRRPSTKAWLDDYALFSALKRAHGGAVWTTWEKPLRQAQPEALAKARVKYAEDIEFHVFVQFLFFDQWDRIRAAAHERDIAIVGDLPIYVAFDSADTWAHQELFKLRADGTPTHVAGVPPDYFSATGQLWGNPIYRYDVMEQRGYKWWISRMKSLLEMFDVVRLDHFRGFEAYWEVPASEKTAINGKWVPGPRAGLFKALRKALGGNLPIIAENLGVITKEVEDLREQFGLPGMKIMQFAWVTASEKPLVPDPGCVFQPHRYEQRSVVYTGSHDNPTTLQWWREFASPGEKRHFKQYLGTDGKKPHEALCRAALATVANTVILPMQDLLGLGGEARMNYPGRESGNWGWRMKEGAATAKLARDWKAALLLYERHVSQSAIASALVANETAEERARKP
ncbi:MAG: 4-alpha-glucanotransferase [Candidatus Sumerlaeota bacterium]|nr:4-alpha-glucanotransferase [Candidatus Sumerlaeota bacterium]